MRLARRSRAADTVVVAGTAAEAEDRMAAVGSTAAVAAASMVEAEEVFTAGAERRAAAARSTVADLLEGARAVSAVRAADHLAAG